MKFLLDGVPVQRTAALIEPYADKPGFRGTCRSISACSKKP